jgi:LysR family transcriptional regulator, nitrogen assimilation regulatory protein
MLAAMPVRHGWWQDAGMNLRQIEYFIQVAELGSFSKAAVVLDIAQPALSRQVRALETELRENLLLRNGRGVTLTDAGRRLLEHGQGILQLVAAARDDLGARRDEPVGQIVVGLPPSLARRLTLPLIEMFRAELPKARLAIIEGFSVHIAEWLATNRVDLGLVYNPEPLPSIEITPVLQERLCLISPAPKAARGAAPASTRKEITLKEVARLPLVMPQRGHIFRKLMESQAALAGVALNVAWEVSSVPAILDVVLGGHGYAALTDSAIRTLARPEQLRVTPIRDPQIKSTLCLAVSAQKRRTPLVNKTAQALTRLCRAL